MSRRLLSEIDKVLRETRASLDLYDERWLELRDFNRTQVGVKEKMWEESRREQLRGKKHAVRTATLELLDFKHVCDSKAKMESDMENTLKRLHRYRQQLTEWLGCTELRTQSDELRDLRKQIELRYKRGRVFYRLGMSSDDCAETDGNADSAVEWISKFIEKLKLQADAWEADVEALSRKLSSEKSKAEKGDLDSLRDRKAQLDAFVDLHKMHIRKLEALLRAIRSRAVTLTEGQGEEIYEALCPYIEDNTDLTVVVADEIYHDVQLPVYYSSDSGESVENLSREESVSPISVSRPVVSLETVVVSKTAPGPERTKSQSDLICSGSPGTLPGERKSAWLSPTGGTDRSPATGGSKAAFPAWNAQGRNSKKTRSEAVAPTTAETGSVVETSTTRRVASPLMQKLPEFPEIVRSTDGVIKEEPSYKSVLDGITKSVAQTGHPNSNPSSPSNMQGKHSIISKPRSQSRTSKKRFRSNPSVLGHSLTHEESSGATPPVCHPIADIDVAVCDWVYEGKGTASDQATMDKTCRVRKGDKLYIVKVDVSGWTFAFIDDPTLVPQPIINAPNGQRQLSPEASKKLMGGWFPDSARAKRAKVLKASVNVPDSGVAGTDSTNNDNNGDANFDRSADTCALAETASLHIEAAGTDSASTKRAANAPPHPKSLLRRLNIIGPNARRKQDSEQASILTETCMGILRLLETTNWTDSIPILAPRTVRVAKWAWHGEFASSGHCQCQRQVVRLAEQRVLNELLHEKKPGESSWSDASFLDATDLLSGGIQSGHQYLLCEAGDQIYIEHVDESAGWVLGTSLSRRTRGWFPTYILASPPDLCANLMRLIDNFSIVSEVLPMTGEASNPPEIGEDVTTSRSRLSFTSDHKKRTSLPPKTSKVTP